MPDRGMRSEDAAIGCGSRTVDCVARRRVMLGGEISQRGPKRCRRCDEQREPMFGAVSRCGMPLPHQQVAGWAWGGGFAEEADVDRRLRLALSWPMARNGYTRFRIKGCQCIRPSAIRAVKFKWGQDVACAV